MSEVNNRILSLDLKKAAQDIVKQMKLLVPVRTGRLQKGIKFEIEQRGAIYTISLVMEDYFKWLKPRTQPLPAQIELCNDSPSSLPRMNSLGKVSYGELSQRSKSIMDRIDLDKALSKVDLSQLRTNIINLLNE